MSAVCLWWGFGTAVCGALLFPAFIEGIKTGQDASSELQLSLLKIQWLDVNQPFGFGKILTKWERRSLSLIFILFQTLDPGYPLINQIFVDNSPHPIFHKAKGAERSGALVWKMRWVFVHQEWKTQMAAQTRWATWMNWVNKWSHFVTAFWGPFFFFTLMHFPCTGSPHLMSSIGSWNLAKRYTMKPILI